MNIAITVRNVFTEFWTNSVNYFKGMKNTKTKLFDKWTLWEKIWLITSTILILASSYMTWDSTNAGTSIISLVASISGIWCVVLVAKGKISNYLYGVVNTIFYGWAAYNWQVYGDFMLNIFYYLPMQFYGWYIWTKPEFKQARDEVKVKILSWKSKLIWLVICAAAVFGYGTFLESINNVRPYWDSILVVCSVIAQVFMARRYAEQWLLWIIVDMVGVYIWATVVFLNGGIANIGILVMYSSWLCNACYGYINWLKLKKVQS